MEEELKLVLSNCPVDGGRGGGRLGVMDAGRGFGG